MKAKVTICAALLFPLVAYASRDTLRVESKIDSAVVYRSGAEVYRSSPVSVTKGESVLEIGKITSKLDASSIQIKCEDADILSVEYLPDLDNSRQFTRQNDSLNKLLKADNRQLDEYRSRQDLLDEQKKILLANTSVVGDGGIQTNTLKEQITYFNNQMKEISNQQLDLKYKVKKLLEKINKEVSGIKMNELEMRKVFGKITVRLKSKNSKRSNLELSYLLPDAGWTPSYDVYFDSPDKPLRIVYKASIYQNSAIDWKKINLSVSSGNPRANQEYKPLEPWLLKFGDPTYQNKIVSRIESTRSHNETGMIKGKITDKKTGEVLPFVNVEVMQGDNEIVGAASDITGEYIVKGLKPGMYNVKSSFLGYQKAQVNNVIISPNQITFQDFILNPEAVELKNIAVTNYETPLLNKNGESDEIVIGADGISSQNGNSIRGARNASSNYYIDGIKVEGYADNPNTTWVNKVNYQTSFSYHIQLAYDLQGNGHPLETEVNEEMAPAQYLYKSAPRLLDESFLTARLTNWDNLNLIPGEMEVYLQGQFVGKGNMPTEYYTDTLSLALGQDQGVAVTRKPEYQYTSHHFLGSKVRETRAYDITVRNNKQVPVDIEINDQIPHPVVDRIDIEDVQVSDGVSPDDKGMVKWLLHLKPGEIHHLKIGYSVEYPRGYRVILE